MSLRALGSLLPRPRVVPVKGHQARPAHPGRRPEPPPATSQDAHAGRLRAGDSVLGRHPRTQEPLTPPGGGWGWGAQTQARGQGRGRVHGAILPVPSRQGHVQQALTAEEAAPRGGQTPGPGPAGLSLPSGNLGPQPALPRSQGEPRWERSGCGGGGQETSPRCRPHLPTPPRACRAQLAPPTRGGAGGAQRADARQCVIL